MKNTHNIAYSGQWLLGSLLRFVRFVRFVRFAHYTTQATQQPPPHMRFRVCRESIQRLKTKGLNALQ